MSKQYASKGLLVINSASQGRIALTDAMNFTWNVSREKNPVNTMNPEAVAQGYRKQTKSVTWSLETPIQVPDPEVDWHALLEADEEFLFIVKRDTDGQIRRLIDCVVDSIEETEDADGNASWSVSGKALNEGPVPSI